MNYEILNHESGILNYDFMIMMYMFFDLRFTICFWRYHITDLNHKSCFIATIHDIIHCYIESCQILWDMICDMRFEVWYVIAGAASDCPFRFPPNSARFTAPSKPFLVKTWPGHPQCTYHVWNPHNVMSLQFGKTSEVCCQFEMFMPYLYCYETICYQSVIIILKFLDKPYHISFCIAWKMHTQTFSFEGWIWGERGVFITVCEALPLYDLSFLIFDSWWIELCHDSWPSHWSMVNIHWTHTA